MIRRDGIKVLNGHALVAQVFLHVDRRHKRIFVGQKYRRRNITQILEEHDNPNPREASLNRVIHNHVCSDHVGESANVGHGVDELLR